MTPKPYFASEKLLPGPPFLGCRVSSDFHATAIATHNESAMWPSGRPRGKGGRRKLLADGWRGFRRGDPGDDIPDQGDVHAIHRAMFPDLPLPVLAVTHDMSAVTSKLEGNAISIALRLSVLPADSRLRQWTSADHQVVIFDPRPDGSVRSIDPMHPQSDAYRGVRVPITQVRRAAKAIADGAIVYELYPVDGWTQAALAVDKQQQRIKRLRNERRELSGIVDEQKQRIEDVNRQAALLELKLAECLEGAPDAVAILDDIEDRMSQLMAELKEEWL